MTADARIFSIAKHCFMGENLNWVKVAESVEAVPFNGNNLAEVKAGERTVCLAKHQDGLFAVAPKCPHAGGFFVNGFVDAQGNVVCPLHRYRFCPANGRNVSGEGYYLKHWPVEVREDGVFVGLGKDRLWGLL